MIWALWLKSQSTVGMDIFYGILSFILSRYVTIYTHCLQIPFPYAL